MCSSCARAGWPCCTSSISAGSLQVGQTARDYYFLMSVSILCCDDVLSNRLNVLSVCYRFSLGLFCVPSQLHTRKQVLREDPLPVCLCYHHRGVGLFGFSVYLWLLLWCSGLLQGGERQRTLDSHPQKFLWWDKLF